MAKKAELSKWDLEVVKQREDVLSAIIGAIEKVKVFKEGDYLVAYNPATSWQPHRTPITNSYGALKKYKVVKCDKFGVPYMKELNKAGNAVGQLITPIKFHDGTRTEMAHDIEFEVDPDYTDAIIMSDEENYDSSLVHKMKSDNFKEITEHNKSLKVNVNDPKVLIQFLQNLKVGDVVYKSIKTHFTIIHMDPIPLTHKGTRIQEHVVFGRATDSRGKTFNIDSHTFKWSAIYTGRPRTYNELKDPK